MTRDIRLQVEASPLSLLQGELESTTMEYSIFVEDMLLRPIFLGKRMWFVEGTLQKEESTKKCDVAV